MESDVDVRARRGRIAVDRGRITGGAGRPDVAPAGSDPDPPGRRGGGAGGPRRGARCRTFGWCRSGPASFGAGRRMPRPRATRRTRPGCRARSGAGTERARLAAQVDVMSTCEPGDEVHVDQCADPFGVTRRRPRPHPGKTRVQDRYRAQNVIRATRKQPGRPSPEHRKRPKRITRSCTRHGEPIRRVVPACGDDRDRVPYGNPSGQPVPPDGPVVPRRNGLDKRGRNGPDGPVRRVRARRADRVSRDRATGRRCP